jgi:short-subunit dehydrogenase
MSGQRVLAVTGASSGIGAALALGAARAGYAVVGAGRDAEALEQLRARITGEGGHIAVLRGDVRDLANAEAIVRMAYERFGRIDVLVAGAGTAGRGPLTLQSEAELAEQIETHLYAPIRLIRAALPCLYASKGVAFVIGSGVARVPIGGMGLYPASKAAVRSATRTLRNELRPFGIGISYVDPGVVDTPFMRRRAMPGAPAWLMLAPDAVARAILNAVPRRPAEVNAAPWQSASLALAECFPPITDFVLTRASRITGVDADATLPTPVPVPVPFPVLDAQPETIPAGAPETALEAALEPFLGRMQRTKLPLSLFVEALRKGEVFSEDDFALAWAGMPNKHERRLISDLCLALHEAGILTPHAERAWVVRR